MRRDSAVDGVPVARPEAVLERLKERLADIAVRHIEPLFDQRCKVTVLVRSPHLSDGDIVVSADDCESAIKALQRLATYPEFSALAEQQKRVMT